MSKEIKNILIFYTIILICLSLSSYGLMILDKELGNIYLSYTILILPIMTIFSIIFQLMKKAN